MNKNINWKDVLASELKSPYFIDIKRMLKMQINQDNTKHQHPNILPPPNLTFEAFKLTPFDEIKAVILGQDPYHKRGQAMGLSFSVPSGVALPPSLVNIFKELKDDLGISMNNGDLSSWARQGVLLLNSILSVEEGRAGSHARIGWQTFTDAVISAISREKSGIVFMLWGNYAKSKAELIDASKHLVLIAAHPSPLARGKFFGCKHFSKTNDYLKTLGKEPINWGLNSS